MIKQKHENRVETTTTTKNENKIQTNSKLIAIIHL